MKRSLLFIASVFVALLLTGCGGVKPYVDVTTSDYATLQLTSTTDTNGIGEDLTVYIDYLNCTDSVELGKVETEINTPSRIIKIPVEKPLWINVRYVYQILYDSATYTDTFVLTPEKNKHYVVKYVSKDLSFTQALRDIDVFMLENGKPVDIPSSRIRGFSYAKECK